MDLLLLIFQVLYWLSGLTCTDENFIAKSGAQRAASAEGVALIAPDTSPSKSSTINSTSTFSEQFRDSQLFAILLFFILPDANVPPLSKDLGGVIECLSRYSD